MCDFIIDLIIPVYNVKPECLKACLASILMQTIIPNVVIVDDCSTIDYSEVINSFSNLMNIKYLKLEENKGSGAARQFGIEHSNSEFIAFVDSDDLLYTTYSIEKLYKTITAKDDIDFVTSSFIQETGNANYPIIKCNENSAWVFARMFRRSFLRKWDIKFNTTRLNEDVSFIQLCLACSNGCNSIIKDATYVWKYNTESLTRKKDGDYETNGIFAFAENLLLAYKEKKKRNVHENSIAIGQVIDSICVLYFYLIKFINEESQERCETFMKYIQRFYDEVGYDKHWYSTQSIFTERYMLSQETMKSVCYKYVPDFTIWEMLDDLDVNKIEVDKPTEFGYEFGERMENV